MARKGGLGKGLDALIPGSLPSPGEGTSTFDVPVEKIIPNPLQPRSVMQPEALEELAASIREHGILQPLLVTYDAANDAYILVAGERRLRAARLAGLELVPVLVRQATEQQRLELALIENVQRADLTPLETAEAYRQLADDFSLSHEEIAARVGKNRVTVTNTMRLLKLPIEVRQALADGRISEGHARALLGLPSDKAQVAALETILRHGLNVRQVEELVRKLLGERTKKAAPRPANPEILAIEQRLQEALGTRVAVRYGRKGGSVVIHYYSDEELNALIAALTRS